MQTAKLAELKKKKDKITFGNADKIATQHKKNKLTARERIDILLDKGSFQEFGAFVKHRSKNFGLDKQELPCDGVITGFEFSLSCVW